MPFSYLKVKIASFQYLTPEKLAANIVLNHLNRCYKYKSVDRIVALFSRCLRISLRCVELS